MKETIEAVAEMKGLEWWKSQALSRFLETQPKQNWRQEIVNFDKEDFSYNVFPTWEEIW